MIKLWPYDGDERKLHHNQQIAVPSLADYVVWLYHRDVMVLKQCLIIATTSRQSYTVDRKQKLIIQVYHLTFKINILVKSDMTSITDNTKIRTDGQGK